MKGISCITLSLLFVACALNAQESPLAKVEGQPDLVKAERAKFRETYVNTAADFSRYNKLFLGDAFFDYREAGNAQRWRSGYSTTSSKSVFGISEGDRKKFEQVVDEAFTKELSKTKHFTLVDELDDNTIIMRGAAVDIVSLVPPEFTGRSEIYLASVGEATLILEFLDGKTGEVLARVAERRGFGQGHIGMTTMPTNSVTAWAEVRRWATRAAKRLRIELDDAMGG